MQRKFLGFLIAACFAALFLACYAPVLFQNRQFGYRDAAHYYYPLYERVEAEWNAGRTPLWEPEENGGMPIVGNPTAAVFYPVKIIYRLFPYPWAARLYVIVHTALAFVAALALLRSWGTSWTGSAIAALSYAFGAPILFQYCNIIYLVGSAWLPIGLLGIDRWLRLGRRFGLIVLALALAMEILGGDLEIAYVSGLCAAGYALGLAWLRAKRPTAPVRAWPIRLGAVAVMVVWCAVVLILAARLPSLRPFPNKPPPRAFVWMPWVPTIVIAAWGLAALFLLLRWRRAGWRSPFGTMITGLIGAAVLAGSLAAAQLFPVLEFSRQSSRAAGEGIHDIYPFSLAPMRLAEFIWPNVFGTAFAYNRNWLLLIPRPALHSPIWTPSLYVGAFTLILALGAAGFRGAQPWRGWLTGIAIVSLLASLGQFTGPLWWARWSPSIAAVVGPHDGEDVAPIRHDTFLRDGDGGVYWTLATILPGFKQFRYPSKLLTFTALAIAALAGMGWDRVQEGRSRRTVRLLWAAALLTLTVHAAAFAARRPITDLFASWGASKGSAFGPFDAPGAYSELRRALFQATIVLCAGVVVSSVRRQPRLSCALAIVLVAVDLGLANTRYVLTVPQALFENKPRVVELIEQAERERPAPGPFRIHRLKNWSPPVWHIRPSSDRVRDFVEWERKTIQPKYALGYGITYTQTAGFAELYDFEWFFNPFVYSVSEEGARALGIKPRTRIVVYPRRGFDLWNTRYFVIPVYPGDWKDGDRGYASFLPQTEAVYPPAESDKGPGGHQRRADWAINEDFQVLRNLAEYPRAWVVHNARWTKPIAGLAREDREAPIQEILYQNDPFWSDPTRGVPYDPNLVAWVDTDVQAELAPFVAGALAVGKEPVTVTIKSPQRVELDATLVKPGLVILSDVYYPGWKLTIDDKPAPIYRANRMMRAAAVQAGNHHLVYTYEPSSFYAGRIVTFAALCGLLLLGIYFKIRPVSERLAAGAIDASPERLVSEPSPERHLLGAVPVVE